MSPRLSFNSRVAADVSKDVTLHKPQSAFAPISAPMRELLLSQFGNTPRIYTVDIEVAVRCTNTFRALARRGLVMPVYPHGGRRHTRQYRLTNDGCALRRELSVDFSDVRSSRSGEQR